MSTLRVSGSVDFSEKYLSLKDVFSPSILSDLSLFLVLICPLIYPQRLCWSGAFVLHWRIFCEPLQIS